MPNVYFNKSCSICNQAWNAKSMISFSDQFIVYENGQIKLYEEIKDNIENFFSKTQGACDFCGALKSFSISNITVEDSIPQSIINGSMYQVFYSSKYKLSWSFQKVTAYFLRRKKFPFSNKYEVFLEKPFCKDGIFIIDKDSFYLCQEIERSSYSKIISSNIESVNFDRSGCLVSITGQSKDFSAGQETEIYKLIFNLDDKTKSSITLNYENCLIIRLLTVQENKIVSEIEMILENAKYLGGENLTIIPRYSQ